MVARGNIELGLPLRVKGVAIIQFSLLFKLKLVGLSSFMLNMGRNMFPSNENLCS